MQVRDPPPNFETRPVSSYACHRILFSSRVVPYRKHHGFHKAGFLWASPAFGPELLRIRAIDVLVMMQDPGVHPDLSLLRFGQLVARLEIPWDSHTPGGK